MQSISNVAFVGIGNMGSPMAARLARKSFAVTVYDARPITAETWARAHPGRHARSLDELASNAEVVIFMVPDDKVVKSVLFGDKLAARLARGTVVIDMSSSHPAGTAEIGHQLAALGLEYLDAPVMGGVPFARDGTLDIMVGGNAGVIARCRPLFEALGRKIYTCGPLGSGHVMKALANFINACAFANTLEAMVIGRKFGLDAATMAEAIDSMCNGRQHPVRKKVVPQVLTRGFNTGMSMQFIAKDVAIAVDVAARLGVRAPVAERTVEVWREACTKLGGTRDQTEIARYWEEQAGATLAITKEDTEA